MYLLWGESDRTVRIDKIRLGPLNHPNKMDMDRIFGFLKTRQPISGPVETACHGSTRIFLGGKSFFTIRVCFRLCNVILSLGKLYNTPGVY